MALFDPFQQRGLRLRNRIAVSPMCQYSSPDGVPTDWHLVHLGSRGVGGAGVVFAEASAVSPEGRISPDDAGIWNDMQASGWARIVAFLRGQGAVAGVQLAHAGRKAATAAPWLGGKSLPADDSRVWQPLAPSALAFDAGYVVPEALDLDGINKVVADFRAAAQRALDVGFELVELHAAHGYLLHEFLSPLSNQREDDYGGSFDNRCRILRDVVIAVREVWPERLPLWLRISATDWAEGGWEIEQSIALARQLAPLGVDLVDCSSGGLLPNVRIPTGPGYQVPFAARVRREAGVASGAVGMITSGAQAEAIIADGQADVVLLAREMLRDPYFPRRAAAALGCEITPPEQYGRAW